jgi:hypothetical protein
MIFNSDNFGFEVALSHLREGKKLLRSEWDGAVWIHLRPPSDYNTPAITLPYFCMSTAQGDLVPWVASHCDLLAKDWNFAPSDLDDSSQSMLTP